MIKLSENSIYLVWFLSPGQQKVTLHLPCTMQVTTVELKATLEIDILLKSCQTTHNILPFCRHNQEKRGRISTCTFTCWMTTAITK